MKEVVGDIWSYYRSETQAYIVVPTNGFVKNNGACVMGRGVALQCCNIFPGFATRLGTRLNSPQGNRVYRFAEEKVLTFPTKHNWWEKSDLDLIAKSMEQLIAVAQHWELWEIYMPRVGCGNGGLKWADVKPVISPYMDERFTIVDLKGGE